MIGHATEPFLATGQHANLRVPLTFGASIMHCKRMRFFVACLLTSVTAIAAEEPQQVYVLCEESSGSSETHSAAYIFDFKQNVFYPIAHADDLTRFSETPTEITWEDRSHKLAKDGAFHLTEEAGSLNRVTGIGEKTISVTTPTGTNTTAITLKCFSGKGAF